MIFTYLVGIKKLKEGMKSERRNYEKERIMNERRNEIREKELREGRNITVGIKNKGRND